MTANTLLQFAAFLILLLALSKPLGEYMEIGRAHV
jgi:hypothetical protein